MDIIKAVEYMLHLQDIRTKAVCNQGQLAPTESIHDLAMCGLLIVVIHNNPHVHHAVHSVFKWYPTCNNILLKK